jgi:hypothetical protein
LQISAEYISTAALQISIEVVLDADTKPDKPKPTEDKILLIVDILISKKSDLDVLSQADIIESGS